MVRRHHQNLELESEFVSSSQSAAIYGAVLDQHGGLIVGCAAMSLLRDPKVNSQLLESVRKRASNTSIFCIDGNFVPGTCVQMLSDMHPHAMTVFEPTSVEKSREVTELLRQHETLVDLMTPNTEEVVMMAETWGLTNELDRDIKYRYIHPNGEVSTNHQIEEVMDGNVLSHMKQLLSAVPTLLLKLGSQGVMLVYSDHQHIHCHHYMANTEIQVVNVTGAGDTLVGAFLGGLFHHSQSPQHVSPRSLIRKLPTSTLDQICLSARQCAELTLLSEEAVSPDIPKLYYKA
jgi:sugar/nucleoside kinase (ribokinase family)